MPNPPAKSAALSPNNAPNSGLSSQYRSRSSSDSGGKMRSYAIAAVAIVGAVGWASGKGADRFGPNAGDSSVPPMQTPGSGRLAFQGEVAPARLGDGWRSDYADEFTIQSRLQRRPWPVTSYRAARGALRPQVAWTSNDSREAQ